MNWFEQITDMTEEEFKHSFTQNSISSVNKYFKSGTLLIITLQDLLNKINQEHPVSISRNVSLHSLGSLRKSFGLKKQSKIDLLFGNDADVKILQRTMKSSVFLVASNFDGLEHKNEKSRIEHKNFITNYINDHTQGPSAALCSPTAAIYRSCYCGFNKINALENLNDIYNVENGYADLSKFNETKCDLNKLKSAGLYKAIIHENLDILSSDFTKMISRNEIDQVYGAGINIKQREAGRLNKVVCDKYPQLLYYPLYCAYTAVYLTAIKNNRKNIVLTLLGGGVFGNPLNIIMDAIINVHKNLSKYLNENFEHVYLALFKCSVKDKNYIINRLNELD